MQWDPDHNPDGSKVPSRRAIQLGLKGAWRDRVFDNSRGEVLVAEQDPQCLDSLHVAKEREYPLSPAISDQIGAGAFGHLRQAHSTPAGARAPAPEPDHHQVIADRLSEAVAAVHVEDVCALLTQGADPNAVRSPGGEAAHQPDTPLKMVMFRLSDCMLAASAHEELATIAKRLLESGAEPQPAMAIAEWRYGAYPGAEDADTWRAWHVVAAAAGVGNTLPTA